MEKTNPKNRLDICKKCDQLKDHLGIMRCDVCNCIMNIKVHFEKMKCPLKKWDIKNEV